MTPHPSPRQRRPTTNRPWPAVLARGTRRPSRRRVGAPPQWTRGDAARRRSRIRRGLGFNVIGDVHVGGALRELQIEAMDAAIVFDGTASTVRIPTRRQDGHTIPAPVAMATVEASLRERAARRSASREE